MFIPAAALSSLGCGDSAVISSLHLHGEMKLRLTALGFLPGTRITCLRRKKGSLAAYAVRGGVIALRLSDAALILVRKA